MSFVRNEKLMFSEQEWLSVPWQIQRKGWRDLLYDMAAVLSSIIFDRKESHLSTEVHIKLVLKIDTRLKVWQEAWVLSAFPQVLADCQNQCSFRSCICCQQDVASLSGHDLLLQAEFWALQLLISCELSQSLSEGAHFAIAGRSEVMTFATEYVRTSAAADNLTQALAHSCFQRRGDVPEMMTEAKCRSLLPCLALRKSAKFKTREGVLAIDS